MFTSTGGRIDVYVFWDLSIIGLAYGDFSHKWKIWTRTDPKKQGFILKQMLKFPGKTHSRWRFRVFSINNTWLPVICRPVDFTQVRKDSKIAGGNHFSLALLLNGEISVEYECYFLLWERWSRDTLSDFNLQLYGNQTFSIACFMTATQTVEWNRLLL